MTDAPPDYPNCSPAARSLFAYIYCRGGLMRIRPLTRRISMEPGVFADAVNELSERGWLNIVWRRAVRIEPSEESRPQTDVDRLVTTRWGRHRFRSTWPPR
jgi:hypothetical protein